MVVLKCPICEADVEVGGALFEGDLAECDSCSELSELQCGKNGKWTLSVFDDWEEEIPN